MRIALITYHYGYNEGTMLQAYATMRLLQRCLPHATVKIIDWRLPAKEKVAFNPPKNGREKAMREFFDTRLERTDRIFRSDGPDEVFAHLKGNYDLVIVGSDEVWRLDYALTGYWPFRKSRQTNPWAPPFPNVYWPDAARLGIPCVSLASSISNQNQLALIPGRHRELLRMALVNFSLLTVRDSRSGEFIRALLGENAPPAHWLPDPTFALPRIPKDELPELRKKLGLPAPGPGLKIALVNSHTPGAFLDHTIAVCRKQGFLVVGISHQTARMDINLAADQIGPLEWAAVPALADLVVTDRFHGSVFALKNDTPVIALDYRNQVAGGESKIQDLFLRFGIEGYWYPLRPDRSQTLKPDDLETRIAHLGRDWPSAAVTRICDEFSENLHDFVRGPLNSLGSPPAAAPAS